MKELEIIDAETLLYNPLGKVEFIIEDILPIGLHLFCGASKIGKSWLMLKICLQVSKGEPLWELKTKQCDVLYMCLEDTLSRIQDRLFKLTDEANNKLHFTTSTNKISNGLIVQIETYLKKYPDTKLIIIDTLQKIRNQGVDNSYTNDYGDISLLKNIADKYKIAIIIVHHTRKQNDSDVFNKVSGTTGIMGSSDTTFILDKKSRTESTATLYITGRDVEYQELLLRFENCEWKLISRASQEELEEQQTPPIIFKILKFMEDKNNWTGSATELLEALNDKEVTPNVVTKILNQYNFTKLKDNNISFSVSRNKYGRQINLIKDDSNDSDDGKYESENNCHQE